MNLSKQSSYAVPLVTLTVLFFMWGFITCLNDMLIPYFKNTFDLTHFQSNLVQTAFFMAYFVISLLYFVFSAKWFDPIRMYGYKAIIITGLLISSLACFMFFNEASSETPRFGVFLFALFLLGTGFTFLQISANPLVSILGPAKTSSSRLNLSNGFNALGTTLAPVIGGHLIFTLFHTSDSEGAKAVQMPYLCLASILLILAAIIFFTSIPDMVEKENVHTNGKIQVDALKYPHLVFGMLGIFFYVGGEVTIGSNLVSYMKESLEIVNEATASKYLAFYWGGAMIGRFVGSISMSEMKKVEKYVLMALTMCTVFLLIFIITDFSFYDVYKFLIYMALNYAMFIVARSIPSLTLGIFAVVNIGLIIFMLLTSGYVSLWSILAVGLFNSIMFSNIFTLAIKGLGKHTSQGSSLLVMMILGGAVMPPLQGVIADFSNIQIAFVVPIVCYAYLAWYGFIGCNAVRKDIPDNTSDQW